MLDKYILINGEPVVCNDPMTWAQWFEDIQERIVAQEDIDGSTVSTVFLGLDYNFSGVGPPILFETMIFGGPHDGYQERCSTWAKAEKMHAKARALVLKTKNRSRNGTS